jgi:hypothetical protein
MIDEKILKKKCKEVEKIVDNKKATYEELMWAYGFSMAIGRLYPFQEAENEAFIKYLDDFYILRGELKRILGDSRRKSSFFANEHVIRYNEKDGAGLSFSHSFREEMAVNGEYNDNKGYERGYSEAILLDIRPDEEPDYNQILKTRQQEELERRRKAKEDLDE